MEVKFNEIADRIEKGEINDEEGYEIFKEFEDQMVLECMKEQEPPQFDKNNDKSMNCEMRVRLTWFAGSGAAQQECQFRYSQQCECHLSFSFFFYFSSLTLSRITPISLPLLLNGL